MENNIVSAGKYRIQVVYEDNHIIVISKPVNMPTQADASGDMDVQTALKGYIKDKYAKPGEVFLALCHRLDRPAGGLMLLCRTSKAATRMTEKFAKREVDKRYVCAVRGRLTSALELEDWLLKADARTPRAGDRLPMGSVRVVECGTAGAKLARLSAEPLAEVDGVTLVGVKLYTGRAHQIRVQLAHAGYPLWGDNRYGDGVPGQQLALWSARLAFEHPVRHEWMEFSEWPMDCAPWHEFKGKVNDAQLFGQDRVSTAAQKSSEEG